MDIRFEDDDDEFFVDNKKSNLKTNIEIGKSTKYKPKPKQTAPKPPPFMDRTFEMFSNPNKSLPRQQNEQFDDDEGDEEHSQAESEEPQGFEEQEPAYANEEYEARNEPSPGYKTIEDEKQDLIYKFHRMEQKGIKVPKKFNVYSDIDEMRTEYIKLKKDVEITASLKVSKRILLAVVTGSEFLNNRFTWF